MKNIPSLLALLLSLFIGQVLHAATFHTIIFADTQDPKIGPTCLSDFKKMENEFDAIASYTGMTHKTYHYKGSSFTRSTLESVLASLTVNEDDVVFFYYSGHGFRYDNQRKKWPRLALGHPRQALQQRDTDLAWVKKKIEDKGGRLNIFLADCCNNRIGINLPANIAFEEDPNTMRLNYKRLFGGMKGTIIASGSQPGQYSYCNTQYGGYFTHFFLDALHSAAADSGMELDSAWKDILSDAQVNTKNFTKKAEIPQEPQYSIEDVADPWD